MTIMNGHCNRKERGQGVKGVGRHSAFSPLLAFSQAPASYKRSLHEWQPLSAYWGLGAHFDCTRKRICIGNVFFLGVLLGWGVFSLFLIPRLQRTLPAGRSFVAMDTKQIPQILQQIFTSTMLSNAWAALGEVPPVLLSWLGWVCVPKLASRSLQHF